MKVTAVSEGSQLRIVSHSFQSGPPSVNQVTVFPDHFKYQFGFRKDLKLKRNIITNVSSCTKKT